MSVADAWVSIVSTGGSREFTWVSLECTGVSLYSGTARRRQRRIVNPIHAALEKGLGDKDYRKEEKHLNDIQCLILRVYSNTTLKSKAKR